MPKPQHHAWDHLPGGEDPLLLPLILGAGYVEQVLSAPTLLGYWPLDELSGNAIDAGPGGYDEVAHGTIGYRIAGADAKHMPYGVQLNGAHTSLLTDDDGYEDGGSGIATLAGFSGHAPYTVEAWIKADVVQQTIAPIITCYDGGSPFNGWTLRLDSARHAEIVRGGSGGIDGCTSAVTVNAGEWVYVAGEYDGSTLNLYLNGVLEATLASSRAQGVGGNLCLGVGISTSPGVSFFRFQGGLQHCAIYTAALGATVIQEHFAAASGIATPGGVTTPALADGSVTTAKIADGAVTTTQIADGTIATADLANDSVTASKIAADAVGSSEIAAGAVGTSELADGAVTAAKLEASPTGNNGKWMKLVGGVMVWTTLDAAAVGAVPTSRQVIAGTGLSGGGDLSADRTFSLPNVGPGVVGPIGDSTHVPVLSIDAQGRVTGLSSTTLSSPSGVTFDIRSSDPASPATGYCYFNSVTRKLNLWDGANWDRVSLALDSYPASVIVDGPVIYLRFEESSGTSCADATGNGHTGTTHGTVTRNVASHAGLGVGVTLGGASTDYIDAPDSAALDITGAWTFECWVKPSSFTGDPFLISKGQDDSTHGGYAVWVMNSTPGKIRLSRGNIGSIGAGSTGVLSTGVWSHVVVTRDGSGVIVYYINGAAAGTYTDTTAVQATAQPLTIGCNLAAGVVQEPLNGSIDEIAIYNFALSAARVSAHYAAAV
jgi:hypothetical protein